MMCLKCKKNLILIDERSYYDHNAEDKEGYIQQWLCNNEKCEIDKIHIYINENT